MKKLTILVLLMASVAQAQSTYVTGRTAAGGACTLMADGASSDAKTANSCSLTDVSLGYMFNGTSWDRIRGTATYGLATDIVRMPAVSVSATLNALNQTLELPVTGQMSVGFSVVPSAFSGDLRAEYQMGDNIWYATNIYQLSTTAGITWTHRGPTLNNPVAAPYVILTIPGATKYRLKVTFYSSGSVAVFMSASYGSTFQYLATTTGTDTAPGLLQTAFDGSLLVSNTNPAKMLVTTTSEAALTGALPSNGTAVAGRVTTAAPSYSNNTLNALSLDTSGNLRVNVMSGGGTGGTSSTFGAAFPGTGTAVGFKDSAGTNMAAGNLDASGNLKVNVAAGGAGGGNAQLQVYDGAAWQNIRDVAESASVKHVPIKIMDTTANVATVSAAGALKVDNSAVTQPVSGTFWQATQPVSGTFWQATQPVSGTVTANVGTTNGLALDSTLTGGTAKSIVRGAAKGTSGAADATTTAAGANHQGLDVVLYDATGNVIGSSGNMPVTGSVTANAGSGNFTVVQPTGSNLHAVLDSNPSTIIGGVKLYDSGGGNVATVTAASALKVDNSAVTQPVSGTITSNQGTAAAGSGAWPVTVTEDTTNTVVKPGDATNKAIRVNVVAGGGAGGTSSSFAAAFPATGTAAGFTDGTNMVSGKVMTSAPASNDPGLVVRIAGGSASDPSNVSATGAAVPANAGYAGMNVGGNLTGLTGTANGLKVDGSAVTQPVSGTFWQATQPVSAASLPLPTGAAQDSTLTGGTTKAITRGGAKGATAAADVTSTANGADHQGLDVQIQNASIPVTGTFWQATQPVSISGNQAVNVAQINGVTPLMGAGNTGTGSPRVTIASDQAAIAVTAAQATAANLNATVVGASADNAAAASNNVNVLPAIVETSTTMPTRTDGNRAALIVDAKGRLVTRISSTNPWSCAQSGITALTECKALTASTVHYVTHVVLSNGPTAQTLQIVYGTGTNCGTGQTALTSTIYLGVNGGAVIPFDSSPLAPASGNAICCKPSGATAFSCTLAGYSE